MIALALSGGGARAIAFHLGCMRALHDRGVLHKVSVLSAVSGGSVIAGMYAYSNNSFEEFDGQVIELLKRGLQKSAFHRLFSPNLLIKVALTNMIARPAAVAAHILKLQPPFRRWASRTDALESALSDIFYDNKVYGETRRNLDIVINACELRTGTAFRFGNRRSGSWRVGEIQGNDVSIAHAVTCSAAYPMFLPAIDREYIFVKHGKTKTQRVSITDGGVYDNLGISCLEPGRDDNYSLHSYNVDYIICCNAGYGQMSGNGIPFGFYSRATAAFEAIFRKVQDGSMHRLHMHKHSGKIKGFVLPYLGQQDRSLPLFPHDLVRREDVIGYPTNFAKMPQKDIERLTARGEQLTRLLINYYCPEI